MRLSQIEIGTQLVRDNGNDRQTWTVEAVSGSKILARNDMTGSTDWFAPRDFEREFTGC